MDNSARPELIPELEAIRSRAFAVQVNVEGLAARVTDELFNQRPEPQRWSMFECIDHLVVSGEQIVDVLDVAIEAGHRAGRYNRGPFRYNPLGNWFVKSNSADTFPPKRKFKAPARYRPHRKGDMGAATAAFATFQDNFVERIEAASGLDLARIKARSPVSRLLRLSLGQWLQLVVGHEERHVKQAEMVAAGLAGKSL